MVLRAQQERLCGAGREVARLAGGVHRHAEAAGQEANIIFGTVKNDQMLDEISVTVIATGFNLNGDLNDSTTSFRSETREKASSDIGVEKIERDQHRPIAARTGFDEMNKLDENKNQEEDLNTPTFLRRQKNG